MSYSQKNVPVNANLNQNVLNAFLELNIKEEILIKEEDLHVTAVEETFNLAGEYLRIIRNHDSAVRGSMVRLRAAAEAMLQPNGILVTNAKAMVRASRSFVKNMKQIFKLVKTYEGSNQIAPDYNLQDENEISSLGWYARMVRQTRAQTKYIGAAIRLYRGSRCESIFVLSDQLTSGTNLLFALRAHARTRYPNYNNYIIF